MTQVMPDKDPRTSSATLFINGWPCSRIKVEGATVPPNTRSQHEVIALRPLQLRPITIPSVSVFAQGGPATPLSSFSKGPKLSGR